MVRQDIKYRRDQVVRLLEDFQQLSSSLNQSPSVKESWRESLYRESHTIAIVGSAGVGKSSLFNAIVGNELSPVKSADSVTTRIPLKFKQSHSYAKLQYENKGGRQTLSSQNSHSSEDIRQMILASFIKVDEGSQLHVEYPIGLDVNQLTLSDTPGLGSSEATFDEITEKSIESADALLIVLDAIRPLSLTEMRFIQKQVVADRAPLMFFALNRIDLFENEAEVKSVLARLQERLSGLSEAPVRLFGVSAKKAIQALRWQNGQSSEKELAYLEENYTDAQALFAESNLPALRDSIRQFFMSDEWLDSQTSHILSLVQHAMSRLLQTVNVNVTFQDVTNAKSFQESIVTGQKWAEKNPNSQNLDPNVLIHQGQEISKTLMSGVETIAKETNGANVSELLLRKRSPLPYSRLKPSRDSVFVSYSRIDWDKYVFPLVEQLYREGIKVWVDQDIIYDGNWLDKINEGLEICQRMILCLSPDALNSRYVKIEYRYFFDQNKPLFPIMCRDCKLPPELHGIQYRKYEQRSELMALLKAYEGN